MTKREYLKKYYTFWNMATKLPKLEAIKYLKKCSDLKRKYFNSQKRRTHASN